MRHENQSPNFIHDALLSIPKFGNGVGLHRMNWLMQRIQSERPCAFKAIKVTGSNGKGSVCAMLSSMMEQIELQHGLQHGLYTSPHLFRFNERIRFGRQEISDEELIESIHWLAGQQLHFKEEFPSDQIGAFEAFTAIALYAYAKRNIEYLVSEAGIGGRYDATRIIPGHIAALTSLDLEHTHLLGKTLELIAYDKADLCPPGGVLVTGLMEASLQRRLATYCAVNEVRMVPAISRCQVQRCRYETMSMKMDMQVDGRVYSDIRLNMIGSHQQRNAEVAVTTFLEWLDRYQAVKLTGSDLETVIRNGLEKVVWHGRCSLVHTDPSIFIDVGHSPMAVSAAVEGFRDILHGKPVLLVTGVSHDKDVPGILRQILPVADEIIATRAYHNGSKVEDVYQIVKEEVPMKLVTKAETIEIAMQMAKERAREQGMVVVIAGGLFLAIEAEAALSGKNPKELRFF